MRIKVLLVSIILQVCLGQQTEFNFPGKIQALLGSCVEIPCYTSKSSMRVQNNNVVWHVEDAPFRQRIIYSTDVSQISMIYKDRTQLVRSTADNCTLRIHKVNKQDAHFYFPKKNKVPKDIFFKNSEIMVQVEVIDLPPEPVLLVPSEMTAGETTTITCMANYTCASSPPTFTWNLLGPYVTERSDLGHGKWSASSKLDYTPFGTDNGSTIQCTVTYFGGQTKQSTSKINILEDQKTNSYIGPVIGVTCVILLLAIVFIVWRKHDFCLWRSKTECNRKLEKKYLDTLSKNSTRYTDLLERQKSSYYTIEPTAHSHVPRQGQNMAPSPENNSIYENMMARKPSV
ncbi:Schwann cell myelin protein-like isoform X2 [Hyla sarda]|uniref:Schwann cell myelin protein-like isoform X2 n=1 Tax=Hyla sarda TaxID=327740 RepID=UPI0024C2C530|nr:Schwann cell myelin protein-like isoform X2 [Hyla sarda]